MRTAHPNPEKVEVKDIVNLAAVAVVDARQHE
jgi:hypothetical protein